MIFFLRAVGNCFRPPSFLLREFYIFCIFAAAKAAAELYSAKSSRAYNGNALVL